MKRPTVEYSKGEIGRVRIGEDFLASPDKLTLLTDEQVAEVRRRVAAPSRRLLSRAEVRKRIGQREL
jgi:hypothetical protein